MRVWIIVEDTSEEIESKIFGVFVSRKKALSEMTKRYNDRCNGEDKELIEYKKIDKEEGIANIIYSNNEVFLSIREEVVK